MKPDHDAALREQLVYLLKGGGAHAGFDQAIKGLPKKLRGAKPTNIPHTPWRLLEHVRLAQEDIVDFCVNPEYKERSFPEGYWPDTDGPASDTAWETSVRRFHADRDRMVKIVADQNRDLFANIPWGDGQTLLREALLVADHNAYHIAELITVRRALGAWD